LKRVTAACRHLRDKLLVRLLAETGMRIGQALGLRHSDIKSWDNEIWIVPRDNNTNEARAKRIEGDELRIDVDAGLMRLYADYLIDELGELDTDYLFVNLWDGRAWPPDDVLGRLRLFSAARATNRNSHPSAYGTPLARN
jgi:integrase/recombinase XerD